MISLARLLPSHRLLSTSLSRPLTSLTSFSHSARLFASRAPRPTMSSSPITKIVRFTSADGATHLGEPISGTEDAHILTGDLFNPSSLQRTGEKKAISKYLTPFDPVSLPCVGLNYSDHVSESKMDAPKTQPMIFYKSVASARSLHSLSHSIHIVPPAASHHFARSLCCARSVIAHGETVIIPKCCQKKPEVDWEAEVSPHLPSPPILPLPLSSLSNPAPFPSPQLVVVIGKRCKDVKAADALSYVLGYCNGNDVSARDEQLLHERSNGQFCRAKSFDTFAPIGPYLLLASAVPDPQSLPISLTVSGHRYQNANTSQMIFNVARIIEFLSESATLLPGTAIFTGTPAGVGLGMKPERIYLKPGDVMEVTIGDMGVLRNPVQNA